MKKKTWQMLGMLLFILMVFTACTPTVPAASVDNEEALTSVLAANLTALVNMEDFQIDALLEQYSQTDASGVEQVLKKGLESWRSVYRDLGDYLSFDEFQASQSGDELTASIRAHFTERDIRFSMTFDKDMEELKNVAVSPIYSRMELLQRAGLNTLMGMGTVFMVLIIISLIIYGMGFIGRRENKKAGYTEERMAEAAVDLEDEYELVAVITAAIAASEGISADDLVVRSIRRKDPSGGWRKA